MAKKKTVDCQFCGYYSATVTAFKFNEAGKKVNLQLCDRCSYLHQMVVRVKPLEDSMEAPPCMLCGQVSSFTAESHGKTGEFLGRYRVCKNCVRRQELSIADLMKLVTSWTPGILELPPLNAEEVGVKA